MKGLKGEVKKMEAPQAMLSQSTIFDSGTDLLQTSTHAHLITSLS